MIQFQYIGYLLALAFIPVMIVLYYYLIRWKKKTARRIGDPALVRQLIRDYSPARFSGKFILLMVGFAAVVIALANPRIPSGSTTVNRSGIDVMIALDVSRSMLAQDISPSRLERAKQVLSRLIDKLGDDRIGIVVFAGRAYLQMPLTTDHAAAKMYLASATPEVVPTQGTVISDALKMSFTAFNSNQKKYKSIILISDGEDHDETAVTYAKSLAEEGVMINTIGIGSPGGSMITDPETNEYRKDPEGNPIITKLNEEELKQIAENGNGIYQRFNNTDEVVNAIHAQLQTLGQRPVTENSLLHYRHFFPWLLACALLIIGFEFFMSERVSLRPKKVSPEKRTAVPALVILLMLIQPLAVVAQKENELVKKGNEAYLKKEYETAAQHYKEAVTKSPSSLPAQYNLGNALYKSSKPEEAISAYDAAIQESTKPLEKSETYYNKGVALQNIKKVEECIEAYKNALRLNPADEDARLNLQKALQQQKQEEQKKDKEEKEKKKPKEEEKKKDKQQPKEEKDENELPKPQPSKMTKKEAEEKLKALLQQEKKLQDKLRKVGTASSSKPDKDW